MSHPARLLVVGLVLPFLPAAPASAAPAAPDPVPSTTATAANTAAGTAGPATTPSKVKGPDATATSELVAMAVAKREHRRVEVAALTTERRKVVADPTTGTLQAQVNANPVRVRRGSSWVDLDATLRRSGGRITPGAAEVDLSVTATGAGPLVTIADGSRSVSMTWAADKVLPTPVVVGDKAVYSDVRPGIDLVVQTNDYGFSQYLVVRTRKAAADPLLRSFAFDVAAPGLRLVTADGGLEARDSTGDVVFAAPRLQMWGSTGTVPTGSTTATSAYVTGSMPHGKTADVGSRLTGNRLTLTPDRTLLDDPDVTYPVVIDPSLSRRKSDESMVWSNGLKFWNPDDDDESARVGYDGWSDAHKKSRVFYSFDTKALAGTSVRSATFTHKQVHSPSFDCSQKNAKPAVNLDRSGTISKSTSWPGPSTYDRLDSSTVTAGAISKCGHVTTQEWDATDGAKDAAANGWDTLTLRLASDDEGDKWGWRQYQNTSSYPVLSITYNTPPTVPDVPSVDTLTTYGGASYISTTTPRLTATVKDPDKGDEVHADFIVNPIDPADSLDDRTFVASPGVKDPGTAGKPVSAPVPATTSAGAPVMVDGGAYSLYARANDGLVQTVSGPSVHVTVDTSAPGAPVVSGPTGTVAQGTKVVFHVDAPEDDVAGYLYGLNSSPPSTPVAPAALGGAVDIGVVASQFGPNFFTVQSVDRAGNRTATPVRLEFKVEGTLPSNRYRLDGSGTDERSGTAPGSSASNLVVPTSPAATWVPGRDARYDDGTTPRDCTDLALQLSPSTAVKSVSTATGHSFDTTQSFTATAWLRADDLSPTSSTLGERYAVTMPVAGGAAFSLGYRTDPGTKATYWMATLDDPTDKVGRTWAPSASPASSTVVAGRWTHVAEVYDASARTASLYVNGQLLGQTAVGVTPARGSQLTLGSGPYGASTLTWNGAVDEVQLFQGALGAGQITTVAGTHRSPSGC